MLSLIDRLDKFRSGQSLFCLPPPPPPSAAAVAVALGSAMSLVSLSLLLSSNLPQFFFLPHAFVCECVCVSVFVGLNERDERHERLRVQARGEYDA